MGTKDLVDGKNPAPLGVSQKVLRDIYLNFMVQDFSINNIMIGC